MLKICVLLFWRKDLKSITSSVLEKAHALHTTCNALGWRARLGILIHLFYFILFFEKWKNRALALIPRIYQRAVFRIELRLPRKWNIENTVLRTSPSFQNNLLGSACNRVKKNNTQCTYVYAWNVERRINSKEKKMKNLRYLEDVNTLGIAHKLPPRVTFSEWTMCGEDVQAPSAEVQSRAL